MPRYHNVSGTDITVYLDVRVDTSEDFFLASPFEPLLEEIAKTWGPIAIAMGFRLIIAPATGPAVPKGSPSPAGTELFENATPPDKILYHNDVLAPPSSAVKFFVLNVGLKDKARKETQSARISYVDYHEGSGYIYSQASYPKEKIDLSDIAHELGHILGLEDRYFEAVAWKERLAVDRSCRQIRKGNWIDAGEDYRFPVKGKIPGNLELPRYAYRVSLPMHNNAMPRDGDGNLLDPDYNPDNNLMTNSEPVITAYQLSLIGIRDGEAQEPRTEPRISTSGWVAVLGDDSYEPFHAWAGEQGLRYFPDNDDTKDAEPYPCWNGRRRGRDKHNKIFDADLIAIAKGKKTIFIRVQKKKRYTHSPGGVVSIGTENLYCHSKKILSDLTR